MHPQPIQAVSSFDRTTPQRLKLKNEEILWLAKYFLKMLSAEIKINIFGQKILPCDRSEGIKPEIGSAGFARRTNFGLYIMPSYLPA